jgi:putative glutamine amidotransferase
MAARIAIPMPHSTDREYGERAIPQYERAVELAGGEPVRIPLSPSAATLKELIEKCDGVLLPGSNADVAPERFQQRRWSHTATADARREEVDFLLLEHADEQRKPVLGICYGLQSLNVYRGGSLIQHIPDFLPPATRAMVNHEAGRNIAVAHQVKIESGSLLSAVVANAESGEEASSNPDQKSPPEQTASGPGALMIPVNSSHHQSADAIGEGLRLVARCPDDGIIEALEGVAPDHFVLAVQWHPERSVDDDRASQRIFRALVEAAKRRSGGWRTA